MTHDHQNPDQNPDQSSDQNSGTPATLSTLWQSSASSARFTDPALCARKADKFERKVRFRNAVEYSAGAFATLLFGGLAAGAIYKGELGIAFAAVLILAGIAAVMWNLHRHASNVERREEEACLPHLRRQYERQFTALSSVPTWYMGPLIPGIAVFYAVITFRVAETTGWLRALEGIMEPAAITIALFAAIAGVNWYAARGLKRKITAIDALS